jgi:hypothetical protein
MQEQVHHIFVDGIAYCLYEEKKLLMILRSEFTKSQKVFLTTSLLIHGKSHSPWSAWCAGKSIAFAIMRAQTQLLKAGILCNNIKQ